MGEEDAAAELQHVMVDDADDLKEAAGCHGCPSPAAEDEPGDEESNGVPDHVHDELIWFQV